ncbi:hypothetical protein B0H15DRAFT_989119 [Mycena belliarum]|uniref:Uncharacterized protein n=1 Tax=Mycena belliarum TaxID=1033014 RepID=A0AAD6U0U3_9AGAR|nr:hypothetical protein B0H15DRAFT_989119 [Mycena belliae]
MGANGRPGAQISQGNTAFLSARSAPPPHIRPPHDVRQPALALATAPRSTSEARSRNRAVSADVGLQLGAARADWSRRRPLVHEARPAELTVRARARGMAALRDSSSREAAERALVAIALALFGDTRGARGPRTLQCFASGQYGACSGRRRVAQARGTRAGTRSRACSLTGGRYAAWGRACAGCCCDRQRQRARPKGRGRGAQAARRSGACGGHERHAATTLSCSPPLRSTSGRRRASSDRLRPQDRGATDLRRAASGGGGGLETAKLDAMDECQRKRTVSGRVPVGRCGRATRELKAAGAGRRCRAGPWCRCSGRGGATGASRGFEWVQRGGERPLIGLELGTTSANPPPPTRATSRGSARQFSAGGARGKHRRGNTARKPRVSRALPARVPSESPGPIHRETRGEHEPHRTGRCGGLDAGGCNAARVGTARMIHVGAPGTGQKHVFEFGTSSPDACSRRRHTSAPPEWDGRGEGKGNSRGRYRDASGLVVEEQEQAAICSCFVPSVAQPRLFRPPLSSHWPFTHARHPEETPTKTGIGDVREVGKACNTKSVGAFFIRYARYEEAPANARGIVHARLALASPDSDLLTVHERHSRPGPCLRQRQGVGPTCGRRGGGTQRAVLYVGTHGSPLISVQPTYLTKLLALAHAPAQHAPLRRLNIRRRQCTPCHTRIRGSLCSRGSGWRGIASTLRNVLTRNGARAGPALAPARAAFARPLPPPPSHLRPRTHEHCVRLQSAGPTRAGAPPCVTAIGASAKRRGRHPSLPSMPFRAILPESPPPFVDAALVSRPACDSAWTWGSNVACHGHDVADAASGDAGSGRGCETGWHGLLWGTRLRRMRRSTAVTTSRACTAPSGFVGASARAAPWSPTSASTARFCCRAAHPNHAQCARTCTPRSPTQQPAGPNTRASASGAPAVYPTTLTTGWTVLLQGTRRAAGPSDAPNGNSAARSRPPAAAHMHLVASARLVYRRKLTMRQRRPRQIALSRLPCVCIARPPSAQARPQPAIAPGAPRPPSRAAHAAPPANPRAGLRSAARARRNRDRRVRVQVAHGTRPPGRRRASRLPARAIVAAHASDACNSTARFGTARAASNLLTISQRLLCQPSHTGPNSSASTRKPRHRRGPPPSIALAAARNWESSLATGHSVKLPTYMYLL